MDHNTYEMYQQWLYENSLTSLCQAGVRDRNCYDCDHCTFVNNQVVCKIHDINKNDNV